MKRLRLRLPDVLQSLGRTPLLSAVVIGSIAIGIGVNTVVFSWIQARILRPFPGVDGGAAYYGVEPRTRTGQYPGASWLEYQDLRTRLTSFADVMAFRPTALYVGEPGRVERVSGMLVSENYFRSLALTPAAGRFPLSNEVGGAGSPVAVISYGFWQKQFSGAGSAIGSTLRVNGQTLTIIGVTPARFLGTITGLYYDVWIPAVIAADVLNGSKELVERTSRGYLMMGRLRGGVTAGQAQAELDAAMHDLNRTFPEANADVTAEVAAAWNLPRGPARMLNAALGILQGAMLLVLGAVCGNTANLALARGSARCKEMGIRMSLGASRKRIVWLLLSETLVLSTIGAILGILIAMWGTNALRILPLTGLPLRLETAIDGYGLLVAILLGLAAGLIIGAAPAWQIATVDPQVAFRTAVQSSGRSRLRDALMAAQAGLAVMVLIATGISLDSYLQTRNVDPGFHSDGVLLAAYDVSGRARTPAATRAFTVSLLDRLRSVAGVRNAAIASSVPLDIHGLPIRNISVEGHARADAGSDQTSSNTVTPGYFDVMGIPLVRGRDFSALNDPAAPLEAIANEEFVRRFLDDSEPLGRRVVARARTHVIVGVVRNSIANAFGEPPTAILYFSYRDAPLASGEIHVRTETGSEMAVAPAIRTAVGEVDSETPVFNVRRLTDHVETNLFLRRIPAQMFAVIGPVLLGLAALGIYAVVAYSSSLRKAEVGVRLAMGAVPGQIVGQFIRESLLVIAAGGAVGLASALVLARRFVPDVATQGVFVAVPALVLVVGATACWVPARRASRLNPIDALRPQ